MQDQINTINPTPSLQWRHDGRDDVSNPRRLDYLLNRLFKESIKAPRTGLSEGNPPGTGGFPS